MRKIAAMLFILVMIAASSTHPVEAQIQVGATAPNFTKQETTPGGPGANVSLEDYSDKDVVVLFILGYG